MATPNTQVISSRIARLRALGALDLTNSEGREVRAVLAQPKRSALLTYLAVAVPRGFHARDTLLALLWPDLDDARARAALNKAVHYLRQGIRADVIVNRGDDAIG